MLTYTLVNRSKIMGLSQTEKDRLLNRPTDSRDRATNDVKVRKKLAAWLKDLPDMALVFQYLPKKQLRKELNDFDAFNFMDFAMRTMDCLDFNPIFGDIGSLNMWYVPSPDGEQRPPTDQDIERAAWLSLTIEQLKNFYGNKNPVGAAMDLNLIYDHPRTRGRLTEGEIASIEKVNQVMSKYKYPKEEDSGGETK
jgi:hypothetical protein